MAFPEFGRRRGRAIGTGVALLVLGLVAGCTESGGKPLAAIPLAAQGSADPTSTAGARPAAESGSTAVAGAQAPPRIASSAAPLWLAPSQVPANAKFRGRPAKPHGAPAHPKAGQRLRKQPKGKVTRHRAYDCYPAGTPAYEAGCINGMLNYAHWGDEPYNATNHRYVWVVDELPPGSRESAWLQFTINAFNSVATGNRPTFVYSTAAERGPDWVGCSHHAPQIVEVCPIPVTEHSHTDWSVDDATRHFVTVAMYIAVNPNTSNDQYTAYKVAHEFGHMVGFAHDTDCASVMTYCDATVGNKYLWYGALQAADYQFLYDRHAAN